ncbi:hypothetical protein ACJQWK_02381 [Exserohilum turcicum]|uniref:C-CAP/cofactor C-like domain-containing protein n=1 Tax=Exserohilum turcicum (strain 28A) TaxID=671987 RepID=R0KKT8_EXST2|nr:uncharacterized protein SETTUDRAFT_127140 [Exserohilum turcica Et28A]EOA89754.1 hypothetical protein SETTUDRAFT_127140 [Exserohilum turcica Et28A]
MSDSNLKETFYRKFQHDVASLQAQISALPETAPASRERNQAIDQCLEGIDRLSHEVKDASSYLPAYDQRTYSEAIKGLSEKLQTVKNSFDPPKKFSFRNKRKDGGAAPVNTATSTVTTTTTTVSTAKQETSSSSLSAEEAVPSRQENSTAHQDHASTSTSELSHKSSVYISLAPAAPYATSSPVVSHLARCVVDLSPSTSAADGGAPFATLYLRNIKDSLIICGHVSGAVHITHVSNSVVVMACRQFRMHASRNVDIYLHSASRPIFEDCEGLRFAPLPECYITPDFAQSANQWNQIDDFKWLKAEPSPHFSILPENERIPDQVWRDVVPRTNSATLEDTLEAVHVQ